ncbi:SnoaL-like domain protein [Gemmata obscuriglobus]|uniref:Nuclear transport factor 2 family protein n=1 Tax=Gemmata obscuriglobus TaxID=114 RepID=A0A2Z3GTE4_9BACT|nr:nuclear transport factor 2 family protein [Gemmata obscuriglobus]AWM37043.1 nuclear transport factor 2 family protein [Gemmata obscuriglobus]QEG30248.1 SnoaL-like domain protein [Gemmata obscuriglobus]VTS09572.1 ketosteroid isomerase : Ketosteroid isomerase OS=Flavobacterium rivuli WB 3.3-2 = DSM 21788 GN=Q765_18310 PE=4 SV=1: SnoaL_2 [Gemmata obscuriglobus UQM 2246]
MSNNKTVLEQANAAVTKGDNEGFLSFCTDDTLWTFVGDRVLRGKEAVRQWMAESYSQGPPELTVDHLIAEGEFVTAVGVVSTRDKGGKTTRYAYCDVWRVQDGKLAELRAFVIEEKG